MSSEEDVTVDSFSTALKKAKRSRQRVDAGEPRNSYSSIPNFSSRPNLSSSDIYAFVTAQNHIASAAAVASANQHFFAAHNDILTASIVPSASINSCYSQGLVSPTKMLNELLSRRVKTTDNGISGRDTAIMPLNIAGNDVSAAISSNVYATDCITSSQSLITRVSSNTMNGDGSASSNRDACNSPVGNMAQHMLRNILQGAVGRSKKELYALEQEFRAATNNNEFGVECANNTNMLNNNNITNINNNNNVKLINCISNETNCNKENEEQQDVEHKTSKENLFNGNVENMDVEDGEDNQLLSQQHNMDESSLASQTTSHGDKLDHDCNSSSLDKSVSSPAKSDISAEDCEDNITKDYKGNDSTKNGPLCQIKNTEQAELKRARVENIVSGMHSSPLLPVNGCKKRKLYHPQQHDNSITKHYASLNDMVNQLTDDEDETNCSAEIRKKRAEKNALKNQLRVMQERMAKLVQEYAQMQRDYQLSPIEDGNGEEEEEEEEEEGEEMSSDPEQGDNCSIYSVEQKPQPLTHINTSIPTPAPSKEPSTAIFPLVKPPLPPISTPSTINKMLNSKLLTQNANLPSHINPHMFPSLHPNFNGALSFLQHQVFQDQQQHGVSPGHLPLHHHPHPHHPHPAFSNAAAMYQKLFMEQEVRMAKEAALAAAASTAEHPIQDSNTISQPQLIGLHSSNHKESLPHVHSKHNHSPSNQATLNVSANQHTKVSNFSSDQPPIIKSAISTSNSARENSFDLEGLADALKSEITSTLSNLIDTIVCRFIQQKRISNKSSSEVALAAEQLNKDLLLASQLLDCKSPRTKVIDRGNCNSSSSEKTNSGTNGYSTTTKSGCNSHSNSFNRRSTDNLNTLGANLFPHPPKMSAAAAVAAMNNPVAAAALYSSMNSLGNSHINPFGCLPDMRGDVPSTAPEQNEALSLVMGPTKKKRSKVTDTRITPRTVSRILAQDGMGCSSLPSLPPPPSSFMGSPSKFGNVPSSINGDAESPSPRPFHVQHPAPMLPVSLPTSVAIPNPGLHESQVFSPYSPFYGPHQGQHQELNPILPSDSPSIADHLQDSPPLAHPSPLFHPALLAAAHQQQQQSQSQHQQRASSSPDYMRPSSRLGGESIDPGSDCNSMDFEGMIPTYYSSTLSPMHLRKAKLMFFWVRYPTSAVLKMYFPDIKFNKNNTAQLVKWFSNFREFYYIQMEKYARAEIANGTKNPDDLHINTESDIYRVLNLHYNRNNHIEVPPNFRYVVEQTLKEFFKAIQIGKDQDQSWKKPIYKVIGRLDDQVPEYFKSPNFLEQLE